MPSWSPDDRLLTFSYGAPPRVIIAAVDGSTEPEVLGLDGPAEAPVWSPDGGRIALTMSASGGQALFVANRDGKGATQLSSPYPTFSHGFGHGAMGFAWSPDGSKILFSAGNGDTGQSDLYVVAADGTTDEQSVTSESGSEYGATWSPDGTRIAYIAAAPSEHGYLTVANADGSNQKRLIDTPVFWLTPQWSPGWNDHRGPYAARSGSAHLAHR